MFLSNASIKRPVAMSCLIIALAVLGVNAYRQLPIEFLPEVDIPIVAVITIFPGASPEELETDVARRIEDAVVSVDGLDKVSSVCMENVVQTVLEFDLDIDVDVAAMDVRDQIDLIMADFPAGVERPQVRKFDIGALPIAYLALTGTAALDELYEYADNEVRDRISVIMGVGNVEVTGGEEREVKILIDREELGARGLTSMDVVQAVQQGVQSIPSGRLREHGREYSVRFDADFPTILGMGSLEIANNDGSRVYLSDIARIEMGVAEMRQASYYNGQPAIGIEVIKKADANAVEIVESIRSTMEEIQEQLPGGMELVWVSDEGGFIEATVDSATVNIIQGVLLTAMILFLFLYNFRSTLIVAVTMPLTIVIGLFILQLIGYTLNVIVLLALGLSVGVLVTNSIVVMESIVKRLDSAESSGEAARVGAQEVAIAVMASAGTNLVVLLPIGLMGTLAGRMFQPFAFTMITVTVVSLFISFTLTPILCAVLLRKGTKKGLLYRLEQRWNAGLNWCSHRYADFLHFTGDHRWAAIAILLVVLGIFIHAMTLAGGLGFTFMDEPDQGEIMVRLEYPTWYSLDRTIDRVMDADALLEGLPSLDSRLTTVGAIRGGVVGQASEGVYIAQILLRFVDKTERSESIWDLLAEVRERLELHSDCIAVASVQGGAGGGGAPIELEFLGPDRDELDRLALEAAAIATSLDGFIDPDTTVRPGKPEIRVLPNRAILADLGMPAAAMGQALRANLEGIEAGVFTIGDRNYDIRVTLDEQLGKEQVGEFLFPGMPGIPVILSTFADIEEGFAPIQVSRSDKRRVAKVFSHLEEGVALGTSVFAFRDAIDEQMTIPPGYEYRFTGMFEILEETGEEFIEAGLIAIFMTYLVLAAILESFKRPFIILVTIPLGLIGVIWALHLTGESISIFIMLGGVMLVGIVVNNAILILDRLAYHTNRGLSFREAMAHAAEDEFRPIVMITLAAVLGMLPMALSRALGSEIRAGIGIAAVGGIIVSAVLTLIVLPVLYGLFTRGDSHAKPDSAETETSTQESK